MSYNPFKDPLDDVVAKNSDDVVVFEKRNGQIITDLRCLSCGQVKHQVKDVVEWRESVDGMSMLNLPNPDEWICLTLNCAADFRRKYVKSYRRTVPFI